jgi:GT2 family glycosyltransferase
MERDQLKFAAFVMTYKRQVVAKQTIEALFNQTVSPEKVLIIDNDELQSGKIIQEQLAHLPIEYYAVGYNSGPAGAAAKGLQILAKEGYDWIAWIDDDDPPYFPDVFEKLLQLAQTNPKCGCVGVVGQYFDRKKALMKRVPNSLLDGNEILEVDTIAGNMLKIINAKLVNERLVLPDTSLFFGFEELDYDLQIQNAGYKLLVDKALFLQHRIYHNRLYIEKIAKKKTERQLVRDYYSSRNMLYILKKNRLFRALFYTFLRIAYKCVITFKYGFSHGMLNLKYQSKAIFHFIFGSYGKTF